MPASREKSNFYSNSNSGFGMTIRFLFSFCLVTDNDNTCHCHFWKAYFSVVIVLSPNNEKCCHFHSWKWPTVIPWCWTICTAWSLPSTGMYRIFPTPFCAIAWSAYKVRLTKSSLQFSRFSSSLQRGAASSIRISSKLVSFLGCRRPTVIHSLPRTRLAFCTRTINAKSVRYW